MKKFTEYIKENIGEFHYLDSSDNDFLIERRESLMIHLQDLQEEIAYINKLLNVRKDKKDKEFSLNFPGSIWDLNKEQLDFIFEHHHGTSKSRYDKSLKYFNDLKGVYNNGFWPETEQFSFAITTYDILDEAEENYVSNVDVIKSIKFLGDNLKRYNGYVRFSVMQQFDTYNYYRVEYISESEIVLNNDDRTMTNFNSIDSLLKFIAEDDVSNKDSDY